MVEKFALSNNYMSGSGNGASSGGAFRRDSRSSNVTGALPAIETTADQRIYSGGMEFEEMIRSLHELFEQDRQIASQSDSTRCGICYLHFHVDELHYRDEGFYVCNRCEQALGNQRVTIVRRQQKL
jgi:hypothetical protein